MNTGIEYTGYPSIQELSEATGVPSDEDLNKKTLAVIECFQCIPCNPCEKACPFGAIAIGDQISSLPRLNTEKCTGCGLCMSYCPGLAIFVVNKGFTATTALLKIPYELFPVPEVGTEVKCLNRRGEIISTGKVHSVKRSTSYNKTHIIAVEIEKELAMEIRNIKI
jgi:Fe-S-cluster-containing hydrogenase component 2